MSGGTGGGGNASEVKIGSFIWKMRQKPKKKNSSVFYGIIKTVDQDGLMEIRFNRAIFRTPNITEYNNLTMSIKV
jgi:hypothetical protein